MSQLVPAESEVKQIAASMFLNGDISRLSAEQKSLLVMELCRRYELDPLLRPFVIIRDRAGRESLYATKAVTDQLRARYRLSDTITRAEAVEGLFVVEARVSDPEGRSSTDIGVVPIAGSPEERANAMMKAHTKAKRRATLSYAGLSVLDESELDTIPGASSIEVEPVGSQPKPREPEPEAGEPEEIEFEEVMPDPIPDASFTSVEEMLAFVRDMISLKAVTGQQVARFLRDQGFEGDTVKELLTAAVAELPGILQTAGEFLRNCRDYSR